jgi:hypothetical protein
MSSEISTRPAGARTEADKALQPWQFFVLAALGCATAVTFMARGRDATSIILLSVLMGTAALVGVAALRVFKPLVSPDDDRTPMVGHRTRAALEREKLLALRSIKELDFDRAMGKLSEEDFREMSTRLRARAARLIRQLDAGSGYRTQIERELEKRLGPDALLKTSRPESGTADAHGSASLSGERAAASLSTERPAARAEPVCASCAAINDHDARFCKSCGAKL